MGRCDGKLAKVDYFQKFLPYLIRRRSEAMIMLDLDIDVSKTLDFIKEYNSKLEDKSLYLTPFSLVMSACVRLAVEKPKMNRFVAGKRIYDRNKIEISYVVKTKMEEKGQEIAVKQTFSSNDRLLDVLKRVNQMKTGARKGEAGVVDKSMKFLAKLPRFALSGVFVMVRFLNYFNMLPYSIMRNDALYSSVFISNVGSLGSRAPYHHLFDMGTTSVFIAIGLIKDNKLDIKFTIDDRIADGFYYVKSIELFQHYLENPELLI